MAQKANNLYTITIQSNTSYDSKTQISIWFRPTFNCTITLTLSLMSKHHESGCCCYCLANTLNNLSFFALVVVVVFVVKFVVFFATKSLRHFIKTITTTAATTTTILSISCQNYTPTTFQAGQTMSNFMDFCVNCLVCECFVCIRLAGLRALWNACVCKIRCYVPR